MKQIITSLLDLDLYKLTMMQAVFTYYKNSVVAYEFFNRGQTNLSSCVNEIKEQIKKLDNLRFTTKELSYLKSQKIFRDDFLEFLSSFSLNSSRVLIFTANNKQLKIKVRGKWLDTILYETLIMSIITEVYYTNNKTNQSETIAYDRLKNKINTNPLFQFSEFGTRRRMSKQFQYDMIEQMMKLKNFNGTSNVYVAMTRNIKATGTMAHEWIMAHAGLGRWDYANKTALKLWRELYPYQYRIALTDTYTTDFFIQDFFPTEAKEYMSVRQDSGNPILWGNKMLDEFDKHDIDTTDKMLLFSDGLDFKSAKRINNIFSKEIKTAFGIGTYLSNDTDIPALNIVIKMICCDGHPTIKISDDVGKTTCVDKDFQSFVVPHIQNKNLRSIQHES